MAQGRFGPNEWLVDEIYQQYLADRASVDPAWWDFFADYTPAEGSALKAQLDHAAANGHQSEAPAPAADVAPSTPQATPAPVPSAPAASTPSEIVPLRGPAARVVGNMEASLAVPTATSVRGVPAKLLMDNRVVINNHLAAAVARFPSRISSDMRSCAP